MATTRKIIDILSLPTGSMPYGKFTLAEAPLTYPQNGSRKHTIAPFHDLDGFFETNRKYAEFVDILGNVTDEFFGRCNDFNLWFLGKAARNEQFFIIGFNYKGADLQVGRVTSLEIWVGSYKVGVGSGGFQKFVQAEDMTWCPIQ